MNVAELVMLGAGGGVLAWWLLHERSVDRPQPLVDVVADAVGSVALRDELDGRWVWPVPRWHGRAPVISDGFHSPRSGIASGRHQGVDVMYARVASDPFGLGPNGTKAFIMPPNTLAIAAGDGVLWAAGQSKRGWWVVVDHGRVASFYQHLSMLVVPATQPPSKGTPRSQLRPIRAGEPLGIIGADPLDRGGVAHLHFEIWRGGPDHAIDPAPVLKTCEALDETEVQRRFPTTTGVRNAARKPGARVPVRGHTRSFPRRALLWED